MRVDFGNLLSPSLTLPLLPRTLQGGALEASRQGRQDSLLGKVKSIFPTSKGLLLPFVTATMKHAFRQFSESEHESNSETFLFTFVRASEKWAGEGWGVPKVEHTKNRVEDSNCVIVSPLSNKRGGR